MENGLEHCRDATAKCVIPKGLLSCAELYHEYGTELPYILIFVNSLDFWCVVMMQNYVVVIKQASLHYFEFSSYLSLAFCVCSPITLHHWWLWFSESQDHCWHTSAYSVQCQAGALSTHMNLSANFICACSNHLLKLLRRTITNLNFTSSYLDDQLMVFHD